MAEGESPTVIGPDDLVAERPFFVGYKDELRAAVAHTYRYHELKRSSTLVVFGPPGTGKSHFAEVLAFELGRCGLRFALLPIACSRYASRHSPDDTRALLEELRAHQIEARSDPMIVVLDEVDTVASERSVHPSGATVVHWTLDTVRWSNDTPGCRLILGICNYPRAMERALLTECSGCIYLPPPTDEQIMKILEHEEVEEAQAVVSNYNRLCAEDGSAYTTRSVGKALEGVKLVFPSEWKDFSPEQLAGALYAQNRIMPDDTLSEYERTNSWIIGSARAFKSSMVPLFHQLREARHVQEVLDPDEELSKEAIP